MRFFSYHFILNSIDILRAGIALDRSLLRAEFLHDHRVGRRAFVANLLPRRGVGAEIGVFTGLFSTILLGGARPRKMYFIDPWWKEYGSRYPDWGFYTDHGRLSTAVAHRIASKRIRRYTQENRAEVLVEYSTTFLPMVSDNYFDWIYIDSTHSYEGTRAELSALRTKLKSGGIVAGDDWQDDPAHPHAGVAKAVREALERREYESLMILPALQWMIRVR
jgi:hypothetical protein